MANPGIDGLYETHMYPDISDSIVCPQGYTILRKDCNKYEGSAALLIRT